MNFFYMMENIKEIYKRPTKSFVTGKTNQMVLFHVEKIYGKYVQRYIFISENCKRFILNKEIQSIRKDTFKRFIPDANRSLCLKHNFVF